MASNIVKRLDCIILLLYNGYLSTSLSDAKLFDPEHLNTDCLAGGLPDSPYSALIGTRPRF